MWAQRRYIGTIFPYYDPTSTHDDDLPFDLDHVIPAGLFAEHWTRAEKRCVELGAGMKQFKDARHTVGESLGNFRWLSASDNRGRGLDAIEAEFPQGTACVPLDDEIQRDKWNAFIEHFVFVQENHKSKMKETADATWTEVEVATFQKLIDGRTLLMIKKIIDESEMIKILQPIENPMA